MEGHLRAGTEVCTAPLYAILNDEEASQLGDEVLVALQEAGRRRQVAVQLQAPVALVGLPEFRQLPQAVVHLRAPGRPWEAHVSTF